MAGPQANTGAEASLEDAADADRSRYKPRVIEADMHFRSRLESHRAPPFSPGLRGGLSGDGGT